jgi:hypothetical protein
LSSRRTKNDGRPPDTSKQLAGKKGKQKKAASTTARRRKPTKPVSSESDSAQSSSSSASDDGGDYEEDEDDDDGDVEEDEDDDDGDVELEEDDDDDVEVEDEVEIEERESGIGNRGSNQASRDGDSEMDQSDGERGKSRARSSNPDVMNGLDWVKKMLDAELDSDSDDLGQRESKPASGNAGVPATPPIIMRKPGTPWNRNSCWIDTATQMLYAALLQNWPEFEQRFGGLPHDKELHKFFELFQSRRLLETAAPTFPTTITKDLMKLRDDLRTSLYHTGTIF